MILISKQAKTGFRRVMILFIGAVLCFVSAACTNSAASAEKTVRVQPVVSLSSQVPMLEENEEAVKRYATPVPEQLLIINRASNEMAFFEGGRLVKVFRISTGKSSTPTPRGLHPIVNKIKNRPYYKQNIPGGDPRNPLGDRWLGLDIYGTNGTTYAIHGNSNPSAIGYHVSSGCIRMYNDDVRYLFEVIQIGTMVLIQDFNEPWDMIAYQYGYKLYVSSERANVMLLRFFCFQSIKKRRASFPRSPNGGIL